jgi:hypothetical protein
VQQQNIYLIIGHPSDMMRITAALPANIVVPTYVLAAFHVQPCRKNKHHIYIYMHIQILSTSEIKSLHAIYKHSSCKPCDLEMKNNKCKACDLEKQVAQQRWKACSIQQAKRTRISYQILTHGLAWMNIIQECMHSHSHIS